MASFFAYGSLIFDSVVRAVTGGTFESEQATLKGFARYTVQGATYPGLIPDARQVVKGTLYRHVTSHALRLLDRFEGEYYERCTVTVETAEGRKDQAETYVIREAYRHLLSEEAWDPQIFERNHLRAFLSSYQGFGWVDQEHAHDR